VDDHVKAILTAKGHLSEHGLTRRARIAPCPTCHAHVIAAISSDGLDTRCDTTRLSNHGEAHALLDGRTTYWLDGTTRPRLNRRDQWNTTTPADRRLVIAEHRCHQPPPASWAAPQPPAQPKPTTPERPV
jgi:hypothetical protein